MSSNSDDKNNMIWKYLEPLLVKCGDVYKLRSISSGGSIGDSSSNDDYDDSKINEKESDENKKIDGDTKVISLVDTSFSVKQLQDICKGKNLSYSGNKTQLINRINSN